MPRHLSRASSPTYRSPWRYERVHSIRRPFLAACGPASRRAWPSKTTLSVGRAPWVALCARPLRLWVARLGVRHRLGCGGANSTCVSRSDRCSSRRHGCGASHCRPGVRGIGSDAARCPARGLRLRRVLEPNPPDTRWRRDRQRRAVTIRINLVLGGASITRLPLHHRWLACERGRFRRCLAEMRRQFRD